MLLTVDLAFFGANTLKIPDGGWFPLVMGLFLFTVMTTWRRGRELVVREIKQGGLALEPFIENIAEHPPMRVPGTAIFLTANQMRCRMRCCTTSSTTRCCTSATCC